MAGRRSLEHSPPVGAVKWPTKTLRREMDTTNPNQQTPGQPISNRMDQLHAQVSDVRTVVQNNVQQMLERGERLENLDGRAEALNQSSENFKLSARRIKRQLCRNNVKWSLIVGLGAVVLLLIIIFVVLNDLGVFGK